MVDCRRLKSLTKKDGYPLLQTEENFALLSGSEWFSALDLKSGFSQVDVERSDRPTTAFTATFVDLQF